jgi:demethylmenaquinone methyltransferase/2-methoxy-6-polyprenyl-1,4-benzoquinol methylase
VRVEEAIPDAVLRAQQRYYSLRAGEYDDGCQRAGQHDRGPELDASWQDEMARLQRAFDAVPFHGDVIELAAGTGVWTERLVGRVHSLTVLDASQEMLDANRARLGAAATDVTFSIVDLFEWSPTAFWDACVFGFWLCKVPDDRIDRFLRTVAGALRPGGLVCCVDKAADAEPQTQLELRTLKDGREFTIVDHPRPARRLVDAFATAGMEVEVETFGRRFCLVTGRKAVAGSAA